ncbi:MAG: hypothetical protein U9O20_00080 [Patescibacteria group bacterium]|nr:hypothetical protein [Patescibacteria group bacterium]
MISETGPEQNVLTKKFNAVSEEEDQFELRSSDAYRVLSELRKRLEN